MTITKYVVHGIDCTTGKPMTERTESGDEVRVYDTEDQARESMENWMGWWNWFRGPRDLGGTESDFWVEGIEVSEEDETDWEREQREWLIANSERVIAKAEARIASAPERYRDPLRRRAMVRYWQRQIEVEVEFLRNEGIGI